MRKISQIEEGLWKKGFERNKTGEKRIQDKTIFDDYLKTIEWVDMGHDEYLFAKEDMKKEVSINQLKSFINDKSNDIEFLNKKLLNFLNETCEIKDNNNYTETYINKQNKNTLLFYKKNDEDYSLYSSYFIRIINENKGRVYIEDMMHNLSQVGSSNFDKPMFKFKLIKKK